MKPTPWLIIASLVAAAGPVLAADPPVRPLTCESALPGKIFVLETTADFKVDRNGYTQTRNGVYARAYRPPPLNVSPDSSAELAGYRDLIVAAYATASPFLKRRLCWLDYIFIDLNSYGNNPIGGWGFWERPNPMGIFERQQYGGVTERKFVGLTRTFFQGLQNVASYEKAIADTQVQSNGLRYQSNGSTQQSLQSALAHEIAHIIWAMTPNIEARLQACEAFRTSWEDAITRGPLMKSASGGQGNQPNPPLPNNVGPFFQQLRWASLFAAQDPVEDFAETYRLHALTQGAGNTFALTITQPVSVDLSAAIKTTSTVLGAKRVCIENIDDDDLGPLGGPRR